MKERRARRVSVRVVHGVICHKSFLWTGHAETLHCFCTVFFFLVTVKGGFWFNLSCVPQGLITLNVCSSLSPPTTWACKPGKSKWSGQLITNEHLHECTRTDSDKVKCKTITYCKISFCTPSPSGSKTMLDNVVTVNSFSWLNQNWNESYWIYCCVSPALSSCLLPKNIKINISLYKTITLPVVFYGCET